MKILYAIQGTGNGHLSRAKEVIPALRLRVEVDVLVSGPQADIELPFYVKYRYKGLSFIFGKNGGVDVYRTIVNNSLRGVYSEISKCPVDEYDLVVNDFDPISAWACKLRGVNCISLSHQSALLSNFVPQPGHRDFIGSIVLKYYAPSIQNFGFHFKKYDSSMSLPIIRGAIRELEVSTESHYTVYLPSYSDSKIIAVLSEIKGVTWEVFSKYCQRNYKNKNVEIKPIESKSFEKSIASSIGVICGAGFETPAEALFLKKKLLVIPMKGQLEQHFNAASLKDMGVPVLKKLKKKNISKIQKWVKHGKVVDVVYPDQTQLIVDAVLSKYIIATELTTKLMHEI